MVVPYCYQCAKGVQTTILSIANAYAAQPRANPRPFISPYFTSPLQKRSMRSRPFSMFAMLVA